jgi:hypothetical protein
MVYNHSALTDFAEGLQPTGLARKLPGIGRLTTAYGEYLFQDLIPRFKMKLFKAAYERNIRRYQGIYTDDQIAEISANQSNAAFGELNYKAMARHPAMQDTFRLLSLAPDFLEARLRFFGQSIRPGGREQAIALLRATIALYGAGVIGNMLFADHHDPHWNKPFTLVIHGKDYSLRSVPGDMWHLVQDPTSFIYHRLNPATSKPLIQALNQGRDQYGRKRAPQEQVVDYFRGFVPIPLQGVVSQGERTIMQGVLTSMGVSSWNDKTASDKIIGDYFGYHAQLNLPKEERALIRKKQELLRLKKAGKEAQFERKLAEATDLSPRQKMNLLKRANDQKTYFYEQVRDINTAVKAYQAGTPEEKVIYGPLLYKKLESLRKRDPGKFKMYESLEMELIP